MACHTKIVYDIRKSKTENYRTSVHEIFSFKSNTIKSLSSVGGAFATNGRFPVTIQMK